MELQPPKERPEDTPVVAWVVVLETGTPAGQEPLEWLLVSSEGGPTAEWAERIVGWYEARWGIEEYFRVLKSGTRIEDRRLQEADALVKCLAFDAISSAWTATRGSAGMKPLVGEEVVAEVPLVRAGDLSRRTVALSLPSSLTAGPDAEGSRSRALADHCLRSIAVTKCLLAPFNTGTAPVSTVTQR